jgi:hypothetical protein
MHVAVLTLAVVGFLLPLMIAKETSIFPKVMEVCDKYNTTALRRSQDEEAAADDLFFILQTWTFVSLVVLVLLNMIYVAVIPAVSLKMLDSQIMDEKCEPSPIGSLPGASLTARLLSLLSVGDVGYRIILHTMYRLLRSGHTLRDVLNCPLSQRGGKVCIFGR